jgi:hypothetical protein
LNVFLLHQESPDPNPGKWDPHFRGGGGFCHTSLPKMFQKSTADESEIQKLVRNHFLPN